MANKKMRMPLHSGVRLCLHCHSKKPSDATAPENIKMTLKKCLYSYGALNDSCTWAEMTTKLI